MYYAKGTGRFNVMRKPLSGITLRTFEGTQNQYRCRFSRIKTHPDAEVYDINEGKTYYLLTAAGKTRYRRIRDHDDDKAATNIKYDLTKAKTNRDKNASDKVNGNLLSVVLSIMSAFLLINQF